MCHRFIPSQATIFTRLRRSEWIRFRLIDRPRMPYRMAPLRGLWTHQKGGFDHDGRFATLREVVDHYDTFLRLALTEQEKQDLIQHLLLSL